MHLLIVNCAPLAAQDMIALSGSGRTNDALFREALELYSPGATAFTLNAADGERLAQGMALGDFDGAWISGSPLSVYDDVPAVGDQIGLARQLYDAGVPVLGSCYGLQLMTAALGGQVVINPRGREIGVARAIARTGDGVDHPMFDGKPHTFDALCSHQDEVAALPAGAIVLASNAVSEVQAATIEDGDKSFWGVQYHPEFDLGTVAAIIERRAQRHIAEGLARDEADVGRIVQDLRDAGADAGRRDIAWRMGLSADVLDPRRRTAEIGNWLDRKCATRAAGR